MALLKALILPPGILILAILFGWLVKRLSPAVGGTIIGLSVLLLYALSTPIASGYLIESLQTDPPITAAQPAAEAGAIVILSGDLYRDAPEYGADTSGPMTLIRLRYGARLARQYGLPVLVTGGVIQEGDRAIAEVMRETLVDEFHVPVRWTETRSRNTRENATYSAEILKAASIDTVYLVTNAWHMPRAKRAFEVAGLTVIAAPTGIGSRPTPVWRDFLPSAGALNRSSFAIHEWIGQAWYELRSD